jgi:TRAP-type C4-dicarboxylate transport system substrate-binding protein
VAPYFSKDAHTRVPDILLIGTGAWEALGREEQGWLAAAAEASSAFQRKLWKAESEAALKEAQEKFEVEVYEPDKQLFMDKVQPVYDEFATGEVADLVKRIRAARPKAETRE